MADACCLLFSGPVAAGDEQLKAHVELVRSRVDGATVLQLSTVDRDAVVVLAVGSDADVLTEVRDRSPLSGRHVLCGVDPDAVAGPGDRAPGGYVDLVLDAAEPPIPFDDPTVLGIFREYQRSYLTLLGRRYLSCDVLWRDGVRAAGAFVAFTAAGDGEARALAAANPWRRVSPGQLLRLPSGAFKASLPPPGPGTQRSAHFPCSPSGSIGEPGVQRRN